MINRIDLVNDLRTYIHPDDNYEDRDTIRDLMIEGADRIASLEAELAEQCRLHGIGSNREATQLTRIKQLEALLNKIYAFYHAGDGVPTELLESVPAALGSEMETACVECGGRERVTEIRIGNEVSKPCPVCSAANRGTVDG